MQGAHDAFHRHEARTLDEHRGGLRSLRQRGDQVFGAGEVPGRRTVGVRGIGAHRAGAPEDVDALLTKLDQLIAKKRGLKQAAMQQLQQSGMLDPGSRMPKPKGDTGKRLSTQEKLELRKKREKELRKRKRKGD